MKSIIKLTFLFLAFSSHELLAAGSAGHEPSVLDLKYPLVNFIMLLAVLSKVIKPLREKFNKEAQEVSSLVESAAKNHKDAEEKLQQFNNKIKHIDSEIVKIGNEYESDAVQFAKNQSEGTLTTIARMKRDLESKLEGERKELVEEMNHELLENVLKKTQKTIDSSGDYRTKATTKIIAQLRH